MHATLKQRLSVTLISLCVIAGTINAQAGMLTKPGTIKEAGKLKTVPVQPSLATVSVEHGKPEKKSVLVSPYEHKWQAYKGESLQSLMVRWAGYAGYQVAWDAPYDYQINASFEISGDFTGVIKQLFDEFSNSDRPMKIDIYNQQKLVHVSP
ncbi:TPA: toxin co-regulated pilus biosynthesis Q family protein, partial [Salmonella enterica subsp. enterica serovar Birkenhead]